ncbi:hypothetical protein [Spiroplasma endosymbiont of Asaphidion curtum]|uniref:hypothetical protein n=1 Tax=Spiroplasma endosymbiont of Asaphidion curtum TaxID=3066281 RepID=UPI00313EB61B
MKFDKFNFINDKELLRLTGIKQSTFNKMLNILKEAELKKFKRGGKNNKLSLDFLHYLFIKQNSYKIYLK